MLVDHARVGWILWEEDVKLGQHRSHRQEGDVGQHLGAHAAALAGGEGQEVRRLDDFACAHEAGGIEALRLCPQLRAHVELVVVDEDHGALVDVVAADAGVLGGNVRHNGAAADAQGLVHGALCVGQADAVIQSQLTVADLSVHLLLDLHHDVRVAGDLGEEDMYFEYCVGGIFESETGRKYGFKPMRKHFIIYFQTH